MLRRSTRPWTAADRVDERLATRARTSAISAIAYYGGYLILGPSITAGLVAAILRGVGVPTRLTYPIAIPLAWTMWSIALVKSVVRDRRARRAWQERVDADRRGGVVEVIDADVAHWWDLTGAGDLTEAYLIDAGDGQFLYVAGQFLVRDADDRTFPTTRVQVTCLPATRQIVSAAGLGDVLPPQGTKPIEDIDADATSECEVLSADRVGR